MTNDWDDGHQSLITRVSAQVHNRNPTRDVSRQLTYMNLNVQVIPPPILPSLPMSICIRMGIGSFSSYTRQSILHCGVSDSRGKVYNFDENGHSNASSWRESLSMQLVRLQSLHVKHSEEKEEMFKRKWDENLERYHMFHQNHLQKSIYDANANNCYDYVTEFLNATNWNGCSHHTKGQLIEKFLEPLVLSMERYLYIWKGLCK